MNENHICPICGGELVSEDELYKDDVGDIMLEDLLDEKKKKKKKKKRDACYYKVKARYKVWPSAYASGALVKCRKKGAKNWGTKSEGVEEVDEACWKGYHKEGMKTMFGKKYPNCVKNKKEEQIMKEAQLRKIIREMVMTEMGKPEIDKTIETIGDYEIYQPGEYYEHDPEYGTDPTPFAVRNKNTKQKVKGSDGLYYYHPDNRYYLNYGVDEKGDGISFSTGKELVAYLKQQETQMNEVDECWECYEAAMEEGVNEAYEECYKKTNWAMVPEGEEHTCEGDQFYEIYGDINADAKENLEEAEYHGRKVPLGKPMRGDVKKFKVFVRNPQTGKVKKVNFGDKKMRIKKSNPKRRKSFRARHNCANPGPRTKARYWSCRKW
jgi:hypothetical protein